MAEFVRLTRDCRIPDSATTWQETRWLGCRGEEPSARRTGRARCDLRGAESRSSNPNRFPSKPGGLFQQAGKCANRRQKHSNSSLLEKKQRIRTPNMADKVVIIGAWRGQDWRLLNFYREARPKGQPASSRIASSGYLRSLSCCRVRLRGLRTQGLAAPRTHSRIRSIMAPDRESVH